MTSYHNFSRSDASLPLAPRDRVSPVLQQHHETHSSPFNAVPTLYEAADEAENNTGTTEYGMVLRKFLLLPNLPAYSQNDAAHRVKVALQGCQRRRTSKVPDTIGQSRGMSVNVLVCE